MMAQKLQYFILTGEPGIGKTTLIKKLSTLLNENGIKTSGFYTEELRKNGCREGFDVVSLDGRRGSLARAASSGSGPFKFKVGKYGVNIQEFESIALPSLITEQLQDNVLVIDEIGKMEFFSEKFTNRVNEILSSQSNCVVLATIPIKKGIPLIEKIRSNPRSKVWTVTYNNRNNIIEDILESIKTTINL